MNISSPSLFPEYTSPQVLEEEPNDAPMPHPFRCEDLLPDDWKQALRDELGKPYLKELERFVEDEYREHQCFPKIQHVFRALALCPLAQVKVVLLGQDPYHEPGQAQGLCFSVGHGVKIPPSLRNIYKERARDVGVPASNDGDLTPWAQQGVLLLNATLTVRAHRAGSHAHRGWETLTDRIIDLINRQREHVVFLLWGNYAQQKRTLIDPTRHEILCAAHPSPLSAHRGFLGSQPFSKTNEYLIAHGKEPINW